MSTYRRPVFLKRTLSLIKAQTFSDYEVVVSDNDPERSAEAVVQELNDPRFRYFSNGTNLGMVSSFNKSIERSEGRYIAMLTDDDPVYPEMLEELHKLHQEYPGYGIYIGGHDTFFNGLLQARMFKTRVGTNSSLADWELGAVRTFSAADFPAAFLSDVFASGLLWSAAIVKRDIALSIGGFPDFGTPHLADCAFVLLSGAQAGCVHLNKAVACRTIHDNNYSYAPANYESIYKAPEGFYQWALDKLPAAAVTPQLKASLAHYIGRDMTVYVITIKKMLKVQQVKSPQFEEFRKRFFRLPLLRRWKRKYFIAIHFPNLFELFLAFKRALFPSSLKRQGQ